MTRWKIGLLGGVALMLVGVGAPAILSAADDDMTNIAKRRALMRAQGGHMGAINDFVEKGVGDANAVAAQAMGLVATSRLIVSFFPEGTGLDKYEGKTGAKPDIWKDWAKFQAAAVNLEQESLKLFAAAQTGDKQQIADQFGVVGKNGCGGCHEPFRKKLD